MPPYVSNPLISFPVYMDLFCLRIRFVPPCWCCNLFISIYKCAYGAALFILVSAYAVADDVPIAVWAYDGTCEVLLIYLTIFSCLCYFAFFGWPYVNANDAGDRYLFLKYRKWFLPTWTGCPQANPSRFEELNKSMQSWLRLFYDLCRVASEAFPYAKPDNIYVP